jgi:DNA-directed RNA polymerase sigma subunit (sigma70/sigma32)
MDDDYDDYAPVPQNNEGHMSQQEVADELGLSRSRVSEIESMALRKFQLRLLSRYSVGLLGDVI